MKDQALKLKQNVFVLNNRWDNVYKWTIIKIEHKTVESIEKEKNSVSIKYRLYRKERIGILKTEDIYISINENEEDAFITKDEAIKRIEEIKEAKELAWEYREEKKYLGSLWGMSAYATGSLIMPTYY